MTFLNAAVHTLRKAKRPLTLNEIVEACERLKLIPTTGKTPMNTMSAVLYRQDRLLGGVIKRVPADPKSRNSAAGFVRWTIR